ncbi:MAG: acyl-CoA dehydratase activase [Syntrophomonadaceae bacterium]
MHYFLGADIGSVSSNFVLLDVNQQIKAKVYLRTNGHPVNAIRQGYIMLRDEMPAEARIAGVGATGSGRHLADIMLGADVVKNEITTHAVAACHYDPDCQTVIEIGGQDSKIIILREGIVYDFAMNTVCAAGTGSFLDQQASRLGLPIELLGEQALSSTRPVRIAGRCGVFAESDMIHKQQMGYPMSDIIMGLCEALVRNYLNNVGKGKKIMSPVVFQGGVAANRGIRKAFEKALQLPVLVPDNHDVMGAIGAAILACEEVAQKMRASNFKGDGFVLQGDFKTRSLDCQGCPNLCEVACIMRDGKVLAYWGDRCRKWETSLNPARQTKAVVG